MAFVGVAVAAQCGQEDVGGFGRGDGFGGEEGGQAALPVLMLAFDFALGLGRAGVAERDAVEVEGGSELGERVGSLGKEQAVTVHVKFEGQAVFGEGGGEEVEVSQEVFVVIDFGPGADARTVIEQVEQRIVFPVAGEPAVGCGVELPERPDLQTLPAAQRSRRTRRWEWMGKLLCDGPAAHGGRIDLKVQAAMDFGGGTAIGRGRAGGEQFAQERRGAARPVRGVIAAGGTRSPVLGRVTGDGAQVVTVEFVEARAAAAEFGGGADGGDFVAAEGGEDFADQGRPEAMGELTIMFFIAARMVGKRGLGEWRASALRAFRRPPLRSGLLQARRAESVRLCSQRLSGFARTLFAFARNATRFCRA